MIFKNNSLELAKNYDHFILDVWGVIHDGSHTYPGVIDNLKELRGLGKKIYFLSNAPRRASKVSEVLNKFGITEHLYDSVMSSGEATYLYLEKNQNNNFKEYGKKYYYVGPLKDIDLLDGLDYAITNDAADADFVLTTGLDNELSVLEEKLPNLKSAITHNLPMICVNPDLMVIKQTGLEMLCAGVLAEEYKKMGGEVLYFGKPHNSVYKQTLELFSLNDKSKILAIGDGIETDILGANNNNIDSALIAGGILSNRVGVKYGNLPEENKIKEVCKTYNIYPKFILASL